MIANLAFFRENLPFSNGLYDSDDKRNEALPVF